MQKLRAHVLVILTVGILVSLSMAADKQCDDCSFQAKLLGNEEVPPIITKAKGGVTFRLNKGVELVYQLTLTNIEEVTAAHIYVGRRGTKGDPVAPLFTEPKKGDISGTLYSEGTIAGYQLVGSLKGESFDCLLEMMKKGETYVNVHTEKHPAGEIRGQIEPLKR